MVWVNLKTGELPTGRCGAKGFLDLIINYLIHYQSMVFSFITTLNYNEFMLSQQARDHASHRLMAPINVVNKVSLRYCSRLQTIYKLQCKVKPFKVVLKFLELALSQTQSSRKSGAKHPTVFPAASV